MGDTTWSKDAMSLSYLKLMRCVLQSVGAWPTASVQGRTHRLHPYTVFLWIEAVFFFFAQLYFIKQEFRNLSFLDMGEVFIGLILTTIIIFRTTMVSFKKYGVMIREFLMEFHLTHFKHKGVYWNHMYEKINKISLYFSFGITGMNLFGLIAYNIPPIYHNYRRGLYGSVRPENVSAEFSIHYVLPGVNQDEHLVILGLYNLFMSYVCALIIRCMDDFLCLFIFQIIGHIRILSHSLNSFPVPNKVYQAVCKRNDTKNIIVETTKNFDDQENEVIRKMLIECVDHHILIVRFTERLSDAFGPLLAFNYLYHMVGLSIELVECMQGRAALIQYGPLTMMTMAQLVQLSMTFEIVGTQSEKLIDEVYCLPWASMSIRNQKSVLILLKRVQTPIRVAGLGMVAVGVQTMAGILKTTLSYCAFLQSLK